MAEQPRVRRNDWGSLTVPDLGAWEPSLSVSVVIPAYDASRLLPTVLAGLAAQSYPAHLLEVVVANDGPGDLVLPEIRPERTRVVPVADGWGRANACHTGAIAAEGEVLHWLDADMLVEREHVEAQLRWHHAVDYAVALGHKWFVDPAPVLAVSPTEIHDRVVTGRVGELFADQEKERHWVEDVYDRTEDLRLAGPNALRTHVGATASLRRALYLEAGGMDTALRLGEDISLGHRLAEVGGFFVPDRAARSWHLGRTHVMGREDEVTAYNDPFLADRVPNLRAKRRPGRHYAVPYVDVVLDVRDQPHASVTALVDALLDSSLPDIAVTLLGDWAKLTDERRSPLDDPMLAQRIVHATYLSEPRVRLLAALPEGRPDASFRLHLPGAAWVPRRRTLADLVLHVEKTHDGLRQVLLPDGSTARLERTAAFARARRLARPDEDLDDVVDEIYGSAWTAAEDLGFVAAEGLNRQHLARTGGPPLSSDEAWAHVERVHGGPKQQPRPKQPRPKRQTPAVEPAPSPPPRRGLRSILRRPGGR